MTDKPNAGPVGRHGRPLREPWTGEVPSRDDVLRKLHEGTADLLYLSAFCRNNAGGAAILLQHLAGQHKPREGNGE